MLKSSLSDFLISILATQKPFYLLTYLYYLLLLLLLLSHFSRVQLCATSAHQAPPCLGFSREEHWSWLPFPSPKHACRLNHLSHVWLCVTLWRAAHQAPLSTGFSGQEYWSGLSFPYLLGGWNCQIFKYQPIE